MDRINADHWEYLKNPGRMIEGVNYFTAADESLSLDYSFPRWREDNDDHK